MPMPLKYNNPQYSSSKLFILRRDVTRHIRKSWFRAFLKILIILSFPMKLSNNVIAPDTCNSGINSQAWCNKAGTWTLFQLWLLPFLTLFSFCHFQWSISNNVIAPDTCNSGINSQARCHKAGTWTLFQPWLMPFLSLLILSSLNQLPVKYHYLLHDFFFFVFF